MWFRARRRKVWLPEPIDQAIQLLFSCTVNTALRVTCQGPVQSLCQRQLTGKNGRKKWCDLACGWCASNDAVGWQEGGCRNAGTPAHTGLISQLDPPRKAQDPQAKAITFGVERETTLLHRWFGQLGKGFFDEGYAHVFFR